MSSGANNPSPAGKSHFSVTRISSLALVAIVLVVLLVVGCSNSSQPGQPTIVATVSSTPTASAAPTTTPAPTVASEPTEETSAVTPTVPAQPTSTPVETATALPRVDIVVNTPSPYGAEFFLSLVEPSDIDVISDSESLVVSGVTRVDAVVTINDDIVTPDSDGRFELAVPLEEGINVIEVVGSVSLEEQKNYVITAVYLP